METDLDRIIQELENEKTTLNSAITQCLSEWDYLGAHYHSIALKALVRKQQTFNNLKDKNFEKKQHLNEMLQLLRWETEIRPAQQPFSYYDTRRRLLEEKLAALQSEKPGFNSDTQVVFDLLQEMKEGGIQTIKIALSEKYGLSMAISNIPDGFLLTVAESAEHSNLMYPEKTTELRKIGFREKVGNWEMQMTGAVPQIIPTIEAILARVVFEVFYFKELDNPMKIKVL